LQQTDRITHLLRADISQERFSRSLAAGRRDHTPPKGRHQQGESQQAVLQQTDKITHPLRANISQEKVSRQTRSHTF
jgi:hypothetical protein